MKTIKSDQLFNEREDRRAKIERVNIHAIRTECDKAIGMLWRTIEFAIAGTLNKRAKRILQTANSLKNYKKKK